VLALRGLFSATDSCKKNTVSTNNTEFALQIHPCDKRRSISEIKQQFPGVDFSLITDDEDVLWKPNERETADSIKARFL
jgi:hypothetical protein